MSIEQIDHARTLELPENFGQALQAERELLFVFEGQGLAACLLDRGKDSRGFLLRQLVARVARRALRVVESPDGGDRIESWH